MNALDHPLVAEWLRRFDRAARDIPSPRREALRSELTDHLLEAIDPVDDATAAAALTDLGDPEAIVASERAAADDVTIEPRRRLPRWRLMFGAVVIIVVAVMLAAVIPALLGIRVFAAPDVNVVTQHPAGAERVTEGTGYQEYLIEQRSLPPLPAGSSWPEGVPEGMDSGPTADGGVGEAGAGTVTAQFTWFCAWEYEYYLAHQAKSDVRIVTALGQLTWWSTTDFWTQADPSGSWAQNVLSRLRFDDISTLTQDLPQTCMQAGITGVGGAIANP